MTEWRNLTTDDQLQPGDEWYSNVFAQWRLLLTFGEIPKGISMERYRRKVEPWEFRTLLTNETRHLYEEFVDALDRGDEVQFMTDIWRTYTNFEFSRPPDRYRVKP